MHEGMHDRSQYAAALSALWGLMAGVMLAAPADAQAPPASPENATVGHRGEITEAESEVFLRGILPPLPADAPRPATEPRNLEGSWVHDQRTIARIEQDMYGNKLPFTPKGRGVRDRRVKATYVEGAPYANASTECKPPGHTWQFELHTPLQIYQTKNVMVVLFEDYRGVWNIRMNAPHRDRREYMGDSVGHWDGDTLVVETTHYKQPLWLDLDGTPASKNARLVFRIRRIDYGNPKLEIITTVYDAEYYSAPWSMVRTFAWRPDMANFQEYNCEWQAGAPDKVEYGLATEPANN